MTTLNLKLKPFQDNFLFSEKRYPAMVAAVGTGKTMMLLMKIVSYCKKFDGSLALIVRKEYTDLRDSTLKDFEAYFGQKVNADKEFRFPNGSVIMFRHGGEINVLKNINLSIFGIEQAEEFETDEIFTFLRDRLRRQNAPYRQGCVIANTNGHNWIWRLWKNNIGPEFGLSEANTFENADNLPRDFIEDLKRMEIEAPNHYRRYVLNSWEDIESDDTVFTYEGLRACAGLELSRMGVARGILAVDISRYGSAETVFTLLESRGVLKWEQTHLEVWKPGQHTESRLMQIVGKITDLKRQLRPDIITVDDDGIGGGVTDRFSELKVDVIPFKAGAEAKKKELYANRRSEAAFELKNLVDRRYIKLAQDDETIEQLMSLRFFYRSDKTKMLVPKEKMRKEGIKSPDRADALIMAAACVDFAFTYSQENQLLPKYGLTDADPLEQVTPQGKKLPAAMPLTTRI